MNVIQTLSLLKKLIVVFKILLTVNKQQIKEIIGAEYVLTDMTSILTWNFVLVVKQFNSNVYLEFQTVTNFTGKVSICVKLVLVGLLNLLMKRTVQLRYKIVSLLRMLLTPNYVVNVWVDFFDDGTKKKCISNTNNCAPGYFNDGSFEKCVDSTTKCVNKFISNGL